MTQLVMVYVRKPPKSVDYRKEARRISFKNTTDPQLPPREMIELGYAFDGNSLFKDIVDDGSKVFPLQLLDEERAVVEKLTGLGYDVEFS
jgi:hypothetical protein